jgi:FkbM family methyltransferase
MLPQFQTDKVAARVAVTVGYAAGVLSRAWGQRGLGTIFQALGRVPFLGNKRCRVALHPDAFFETSIFEPYWGPTLVGGRPYEPEVQAVMLRLGKFRPTFVDCGANFGYWSILATTATYGCARAIALEANPTTFEVLVRNASLNANRFVCVNRAVASTVGETVRLADAADHAVAYVSASGTGPSVKTTTIDHELESLAWEDGPVVLKIDVEGHEEPAIAGAERTLERGDAVLLFEDFASHDFRIVRLVSERLKYPLYYVDTLGHCHTVRVHADAARHAGADPRSGRARNFVAPKPGGQFAELMRSWAEDESRRARRS